jgi:HEAT repeat protein
MDQYAALISQLAIRHRAGNAYRVLLGKGFEALSAVRDGLGNGSADVRFRCCQFLDHFLTPEILERLIGMLEDPDHRVRRATLHTLACDRCKEGSCRPDETRVLPRVITILASDPDPHVRAMAVEVVGRSVHGHREAEIALLNAQRSDPSATVRKKAGWYAPGGPIHRRTAPKIRRVNRSAAPSTHRSAKPSR